MSYKVSLLALLVRIFLDMKVIKDSIDTEYLDYILKFRRNFSIIIEKSGINLGFK